jgi:PAS domain S-box-containing protein
MHQSQLHPKEDIEKYKKMFRERIHNGTVTFGDDVYVCRNDGRNISVHINAMVTQIGNKKVVYGIFRDITELKKLQQKLADSEQKYHNLYNQAQVALFVTDLNGLLLDCNLAAVELFGYSADEMKENYLHKVCVTDHYIDKERRKQFLTELQKNLQIKNFEAQLKRTDGTLLWVSIFARLSPDKGYIEGALYDITPSKILTKTERIILDVILQGKSNKEIAKILNRSVRTVEDHRAHIMHKLNAGNLVELVQKTQFFKFEPNGQSKK